MNAFGKANSSKNDEVRGELRDRVLEIARTLPQPFLVPDVGYHMPRERTSDIFHVLRDLWDDGVVSWVGGEGYRVV